MKKSSPGVALIDLGTGTDRSLIPLGIGLIASYLKEAATQELDVELFMMETDLEGLLREMESYFDHPPLVIGLACYVWNFNGVRAFTEMLRKKWPSSIIVFGGPSVPMDSKDLYSLFMNDESLADNRPDVVVHMEGEITFHWIVTALLMGRSLEEVKGISFLDRETNKLITTERRPRIEDFTQIPSPYLSGIFDSVLKRYRKFIAGILWETNRGCPFKCSFCDWGNAAVNKVTKLDQSRVIAEIEWAARNGFEYVYCTDANYGINFKRDYEITRCIGRIKDRYGFPKTFVFNWTKNQSKNVIEIADLFRSHGIHTNTTISTQSFNPKVSIATQRDNIRIEEYLKLKTAYHDRGLATYSELILGLPEETRDSFIDGLEKSLSSRAYDQVMVYTANVLNNTQMKRDVWKYGIQTRKCNVGLNRRRFKVVRFGEDDIVVSTNTLSVDEWKECYCLAFLLLAFFNLRIAFYPLVYLKEYIGVRITDVVKNIIDVTMRDQKTYVVLTEAVSHIQCQALSILNAQSSVAPTRKSEGVVFTPHEAVAFISAMDLKRFYSELHLVLIAVLDKMSINYNPMVLRETVLFNRAVIPRFVPGNVQLSYRTNAAMVLHELTETGFRGDLCDRGVRLLISHPEHSYETLTEFNRRRVSSGYSIGLSNVKIAYRSTSDTWRDFRSTHRARNVNIGGEFLSGALETS